MEKEEAAPNISFADSELHSYEMTFEGNIIVYISSWDAKKITATFFEPIYFSYSAHGFLAGFYQFKKAPLLEQVITQYYGKKTENNLFKLYQFEDLEDFPFIQIVAKEVRTIKENIFSPLKS